MIVVSPLGAPSVTASSASSATVLGLHGTYRADLAAGSLILPAVVTGVSPSDPLGASWASRMTYCWPSYDLQRAVGYAVYVSWIRRSRGEDVAPAVYLTQPLGRVEPDPEFSGGLPALMADRQVVVERLWCLVGELTEPIALAGLLLVGESPNQIERLLGETYEDVSDLLVQAALFELVGTCER